MEIIITFQNMDSSQPMEDHIREKLSRLEEVRGNDPDASPFYVEVRLEAHKTHPHNRAQFHLKTPRFSIDAEYENEDMYWAIDHAIDRLFDQLKKEKAKLLDSFHKADTKKKDFAKTYPLGDDES